MEKMKAYLRRANIAWRKEAGKLARTKGKSAKTASEVAAIFRFYTPVRGGTRRQKEMCERNVRGVPTHRELSNDWVRIKPATRTPGDPKKEGILVDKETGAKSRVFSENKSYEKTKQARSRCAGLVARKMGWGPLALGREAWSCGSQKKKKVQIGRYSSQCQNQNR